MHKKFYKHEQLTHGINRYYIQCITYMY